MPKQGRFLVGVRRTLAGRRSQYHCSQIDYADDLLGALHIADAAYRPGWHLCACSSHCVGQTGSCPEHASMYTYLCQNRRRPDYSARFWISCLRLFVFHRLVAVARRHPLAVAAFSVLLHHVFFVGTAWAEISRIVEEHAGGREGSVQPDACFRG